jgi:hypothetical protein
MRDMPWLEGRGDTCHAGLDAAQTETGAVHVHDVGAGDVPRVPRTPEAGSRKPEAGSRKPGFILAADGVNVIRRAGKRRFSAALRHP